VLVNGALLGGYTTVADGAFISGNVLVHQFCRVGRLAMLGGFTATGKDVPPFMLTRGVSKVRGLNMVGLRRAGFKADVVKEIKEAFKLIYLSDLNTKQAVEKILERKPGKEVLELVEFIKSSKRGICSYAFTAAQKECLE
ncbi:acyl-[acyl-carrier-protein]--UDP-N-acetylglucosamine O-acyltransferase, partial [Candidatus Omnitrophota bacterium]